MVIAFVKTQIKKFIMDNVSKNVNKTKLETKNAVVFVKILINK